MRRVLILGNSHTQMIAHALQENLISGLDAEISIMWLKNKRFGSVEPDVALEASRSLGVNDLVVLTHLGAFHNSITLFEHDEPFSTTDPVTGLPTPKGRKIIPASQIRALYAEMLADGGFVDKLSQAVRCPTIHYASPPPRRDLGRSEKKFVSTDGQITFRKFADPYLRLAAWRIEMHLIRAYVRARGYHSLEPPPAALDPDGFLRKDYSAVDLTHANAKYGALLLAEALEKFSNPVLIQ